MIAVKAGDAHTTRRGDLVIVAYDQTLVTRDTAIDGTVVYRRSRDVCAARGVFMATGVLCVAPYDADSISAGAISRWNDLIESDRITEAVHDMRGYGDIRIVNPALDFA